MNYNKIRTEILEKLNQRYEDGLDYLSIEDIEDCVGDIISTYGIKLEDVEDMIIYGRNYQDKILALNNDGVHIEDLTNK
ncbi:hypothetical protein UMC2_08431 [[Clostridium] sordellii]|uniref:hypothetical protein n=1 Tax=Paraclostridium sordellii TaxID=1505 RepID=UPI000541E750|nr:hypothetical protein [Paeniclostridium sordellii]CEK33593.1 hypothetical protein UMC2_08431 [[Clostridium] sordellii] [Paeniclostridium sordellii]